MSRIPDAVALKVHERCGFKCVYCGFDGQSPETFGYLTVDHLVPRTWGGMDNLGNLFTACRQCNHYKRHNRFPSIPDAKLWLRLYRTHCTDPWFHAHVLEDKDPATWGTNKRLERVWELF
jgi:HNH endonuclease